MDRRRIVYLMSGPAHLPYVVVSLWTLRRHWRGEVGLHAWPESCSIAGYIARDGRLGVGYVREREPAIRGGRGKPVGNNSQFLDKIQLAMGLRGEADVLLYLDADTTIHGPVDRLFGLAGEYGFCATQWNDWVTTGGTISGRVSRLRAVPAVDQSLVDRVLSVPFPSVNGGVWAARPESPVLPLWYDWTLACGPMFIADETVLHVLQAKFAPRDMATAARWGAWNSSPKFRSARLRDDEVVIYHYHGDANVRPDKSRFGFEKWWPLYEECKRENIGGLAEWHGEVGNKHLSKLESHKLAEEVSS